MSKKKKKNTPIVRNSKIYTLVIVTILLLTGVTVYSLASAENRHQRQLIRQAASSDLTQYEHSNVGDNNAVINILSALPEGKYIDQIELQTDEEPYGIILHGTDQLSGTDIERISTELLRLVDNSEWIEITSSQFHSKYTRDGVEKFSVIN